MRFGVLVCVDHPPTSGPHLGNPFGRLRPISMSAGWRGELALHIAAISDAEPGDQRFSQTL